MKESLGNIVLRTGVFTFFIIFTVLGYGTAIFGLVAPRTMADFCGNLGAHNATAMYYERIYNAGKTKENLYNALDRYILAQNYQKIILFSEKMFALTQDDYGEVINKINDHGRVSARSEQEYISWANEDNRIKFAYTIALLRTDKAETAEQRLVAWLQARPVDLDQPNHAYFAFVMHNKSNQTLRQVFRDYFDAFTEGYDEGNAQCDQILARDFLGISSAYFEVPFNA